MSSIKDLQQDNNKYSRNISLNCNSIVATSSISLNGLPVLGIPFGNVRPSSPLVGQQFFDSSLGYMIWFNGSIWVDALGRNFLLL